VILLCDEDIGTGVPTALTAVGYDARALVRQGWGGRPDVEWLAWAGNAGMLVLSCNKKMLRVPSERQAIIDTKVGIVFLTTGEERPARVLLTLLRRWDALEKLDSTTPRPFAKFLSPNGKIKDSYRDLRL
jgi:hypothetical protein